MIDIVGVTALQEIQKLDGFKHAVIAGGFVRDGLLGGQFTDIDIFVPFKDSSTFKYFFNKAVKRNSFEALYDDYEGRYYYFDADGKKIMIKGFAGIESEGLDLNGREKYIYYPFGVNGDMSLGNFKHLHKKKHAEYGMSNYIGHYDCKYMGSIQTDIIGYKYSGEGSQFGEFLMDEFHYWIDRAYFNGIDTITTEEFDRDSRNNTATLCDLKSIDKLPGAMKKFFKLQEKYPHFMWRTTAIQLKKEDDNKEKEKSDKASLYKQLYTLDEGQAIDWANRWAAARPVGNPLNAPAQGPLPEAAAGFNIPWEPRR